MRSSSIHKNVSSISRMLITEENNDEKEINMSRDQNNHHPRTELESHFPRSSIIRIHNGKFSFIIN